MTCDVTLHAQHGTPFTNSEVPSDITDCNRGPPMNLQLLPWQQNWSI